MPALKNTLQDDLKDIDITDFLGGLNTVLDPQDMQLNMSPDCLNVYGVPGSLKCRGGEVELVEPAATCDGLLLFYDDYGSRHIYSWSDGNLYEVTYGVETLLLSACYQAGERVAHTTLNGVVYFSEGITPMTYYNPADGTGGLQPGNPDQVGAVNPPAFKVVITYAGSIVAGNCVTAGVQEADIFRWCNVNDPSTWLGVSAQAVGQGIGGGISGMSSMSVSDSGVSPFRSIWVGKESFGVFGYKGALGQMEEFQLPVAVGCLHPESVQLIQAPDDRAMVAWLGTDRRVWISNGITAVPLSTPIDNVLGAFINEQILNKAKPLFAAARHDGKYMYILDCGDGVHFVYNFQYKYWTKFTGWTSGYWTSGADATGFPGIFVGGNLTERISQCDTGLLDLATPIDCYWSTPLLNGGNSYRYKDWIWSYITFRTSGGGQVFFTIREGPTPDDSHMECGYTVQALGDSGGTFILDVSTLDGPDVLGGDEYTDQLMFRIKERLAVPTVGDLAPLIPFQTMKASDAYVIVGQEDNPKPFEIMGIRVQFIWRGYAQVGQIR